jgi:hypothetical protein
LGIPIVTHDAPWHINVHQKVPLNRDRDNVTPAYLRELHKGVLNAAHDLLRQSDAKAGWIGDALAHSSPEALDTVVKLVHGEGAVIADPSNPEATKVAQEQGRTVVHGRQFDKQTWDLIRANNILKPAGQVITTGVPASPHG